MSKPELAYNTYHIELNEKFTEFKELSDKEKNAWTSVCRVLTAISNSEFMIRNVVEEIQTKTEQLKKSDTK